jgi:hypothetical protein
MEKRRISCPFQVSNLGHIPSLYRLSYAVPDGNITHNHLNILNVPSPALLTGFTAYLVRKEKWLKPEYGLYLHPF